MRLLWEISKNSFQRQLAYRSATIAGMLTNLFFGLLRVAVMVALYGERDQAAGITLQGAITFTGLTQAVVGFFSLFYWYDLMHTINTGAVASDLLKPMGYYRYWLANDAGRAAAQLLLRGLPLMAAYAVLFDIYIPESLSHWLAVAVAMTVGLVVSFSWRFLVNLAAFWSPNALGFGRLAFLVSYFLSGFFMPLRFYPEWFQTLCFLTPFPQAVNTLVEVYLGVLSGPEIVHALLVQLVWAVGLGAASHFVLKAGFRRLVIQGG